MTGSDDHYFSADPAVAFRRTPVRAAASVRRGHGASMNAAYPGSHAS